MLLVAAGIASYASTVPTGSPSHAVLYVNTIFGKGANFINVNDTLMGNNMIKGFVREGTESAVSGVQLSSLTSGALGALSYGYSKVPFMLFVIAVILLILAFANSAEVVQKEY